MIPKGRYKKHHEMMKDKTRTKPVTEPKSKKRTKPVIAPPSKKDKAKKFTEAITFKKGVEMTDKTQIQDVLSRSQVIYAKEQKVYDDGSQSLTIEIHFQPKKEVETFCKCKGGAKGRTVDERFEHQICDQCGLKGK